MTKLKQLKQYDWKDSNMEDFGSKIDRLVKHESATTEKSWRGTETKVGLTIWQIKQFNVVTLKKNMYGTFYNGDSYIVLNGFKDKGSNLIEYDIHFWIGRQSSQDEYGTAAYKTVELDNFLNDLPVQHREVQGHESELFLSYFKHLTILEGGTDSGFYHVTPEQYESRLLHFSGKGKNIIISEIPKCHKLIRHDDVYILDKGKEFIQWNGIDSNKDEIAKAMMYIVQAKSDRHAKSSVIDDSNTNNKEFFSELNDDLNDNDKEEVINQEMNQKVLYRISDRSGAIKIEQTQSGDDVSEGSIDEDDVFILEKTYSLYVIKGCNATIKEKQMGFYYAQKFLKTSANPLKNITVFDMKLHKPRIVAALTA